MEPTTDIINWNIRNLIDCIKNPRQKRILERALADFNSVSKRGDQPTQVLEAIKNGAFTYSDISAETGIPYPSLPRILAKLITQKKVIRQVYKPFDSRSRLIFRLPD